MNNEQILSKEEDPKSEDVRELSIQIMREYKAAWDNNEIEKRSMGSPDGLWSDHLNGISGLVSFNREQKFTNVGADTPEQKRDVIRTAIHRFNTIGELAKEKRPDIAEKCKRLTDVLTADLDFINKRYAERFGYNKSE